MPEWITGQSLAASQKNYLRKSNTGLIYDEKETKQPKFVKNTWKNQKKPLIVIALNMIIKFSF